MEVIAGSVSIDEAIYHRQRSSKQSSKSGALEPMSRPLLQAGIYLSILLLATSAVPNLMATLPANLTGKFAKYALSETVNTPSIGETIRENVTETVLRAFSNGSLVGFQIQFANRNMSSEQMFPNGSMIFPILDLSTLNNPNSTAGQIRSSFNLTFIQSNTTRTTTPFRLASQDISFNGSTYSGNLYSGTLSMTINVTQTFNLNQSGIPLLPLNIDVNIETFPSDLLYNLTASTSFNVPFGPSGTGRFQMSLRSTNLPLGDPVLPAWYAALILILPIGFLGYMIYRRRRASKRLAQQGSQGKPSYWVH